MNRLVDLILDNKMISEVPRTERDDKEFRQLLRSSRNQEYFSIIATDARRVIADCPVILVDNVTDYFFTINEKEIWELGTDYPNCAPPFERFFMETRAPKIVNSATYGETPFDPRNKAWGVLFQGIEMEREEWDQKGRWRLAMTLFRDLGHSYAVMTEIQLSYFISTTGQIVVHPEKGVLEQLSVPQHMKPLFPIYSEDPDLIDNHFRPLIDVMLLGICFMNCRNVEMVEKEEATRQLKRARERRGTPQVKYYVWPQNTS